MSELNLKIGSPIWVGGGYRRGWVRHVIEAETSRSWVVMEYGRPLLKIPKANPRSCTNILFSEAEIEQLAYVGANAWRIAESVQKADYATLIKIAELIGYRPVVQTAQGAAP